MIRMPSRKVLPVTLSLSIQQNNKMRPELTKLLAKLKPDIVDNMTSENIEGVLFLLSSAQISEENRLKVRANMACLGDSWGAFELVECLKSSDEDALKKLFLTLKRNKSAEHFFTRLKEKNDDKDLLESILPSDDEDDDDENDDRSPDDTFQDMPSLDKLTIDSDDDDKKENMYVMSSSPKGICLIINNMDFSKSRENGEEYENREGSDKDEEKLNGVFEWLGFDVKTKRDQTAPEMCSTLNEFSKLDHSQYNCFVLCILSHGYVNSKTNKDEVCGVDGKSVNIEFVISCFDGKNCSSLNGKPKLFFLQCCRNRGQTGRGNMKEDSIQSHSFQRSVRTDGASLRMQCDQIQNEMNLHPASDMLIGFSTFLGSPSWRSKKYGTVYIYTLCDVLRKNAQDRDLMGIMTKVNHEVSKIPGLGQVPNPSMTLRKLLYFFEQ